MASLWPWLAVAGMGALHGLNPATGWALAVACGVRSRDRRQALRALGPVALGHIASVVLVAGAVALSVESGMRIDAWWLQAAAGVLLLFAVLHRLGHGAPLARVGTSGWQAGLALWSFIMATAHGAGLMLVPALIPLCLSDGPAREITASGSLVLALAAVALHMAAMLAAAGVAALGACGGIEAARRLLRVGKLPPWAAPARYSSPTKK